MWEFSFICIWPTGIRCGGSGVGLNKATLHSDRSCVLDNKQYVSLHSALNTSKDGHGHSGRADVWQSARQKDTNYIKNTHFVVIELPKQHRTLKPKHFPLVWYITMPWYV